MDKTSSSPPAIVVGLDCITGLQTARILADRGVPVVGLASNPDHFCCRTNVCRDILYANTASMAMIEKLEELGPTLQEKGVLFPCTDMSVLLLSRHRERLQDWYHILLPDADVVEMLMDKVGFTLYAQEAGLPVPTTFLLHNRQQAVDAADKLTYPCILKPPIKSARWEENATGKVYKAAGAAEFLKLYDTCSAWAEVLMVQEWIEGSDADLFSCNCYFSADSKPLVTFIARKIRQWPPETGTSCLGEEVRNDVVLETSVRLFRNVNYRGLGYLEMKRDPRTGKHYIIEPNIGRPTGRSAIAEAGGVELLYTMYCDVIGRPLPANRVQKYGNAKWIYWRRDLQSAFYYWRRGDLTLGEWRRSWAGKKYTAVFSWRDRGPFIGDMRKAIGLIAGVRQEQSARSLKVDGQPTV